MAKYFLMLTTLVFLISTELQGAVYLKPTPQFKPRREIAAVYIEYDDLILLLHRHKNKSQANKWGIPGGKVDKNETALQAAIREIQEETGFDISGQTIETLDTVYIEHNEKDHIIYSMFRTKMNRNPGAVKINFDEHKGFTWVTPADALKMDLIQDEDPCIRLVYFPKTIEISR
jgi:8-oxo-dGTP pyrophosphatase MutT (NUDIX family)